MTKSSKKLLSFLFFLILVAGCSSQQKNELSTDKKSSNKRPNWIESPEDNCLKSKLCGVGEGSSFLAAEMSAREALAKYFEVRVQGSSEITNTTESTREGDITLSFKNEENLLRKIKSSTDQTMEGIEISKRYSSNEGYYAFAILDKRKVSRIIESELVDLKSQIGSLIESGTRYDLNQALELQNLFDKKYTKYQLLDNNPKRIKSYKDRILALKSNKRALGTTLRFSIRPKNNHELERVIKEELIKLDYALVNEKQSNYDFGLKVKLTSKKEHLNVEGFDKYRFNLNISSHASNKKTKGIIGHAVTSTGRSYRDAYKKSIKQIEKYIIENLDKLRID